MHRGLDNLYSRKLDPHTSRLYYLRIMHYPLVFKYPQNFDFLANYDIILALYNIISCYLLGRGGRLKRPFFVVRYPFSIYTVDRLEEQ